MDVDLYINGTLRTDLVVTELRRSYIDPWTAQLRDPSRHDSGDHPPLWSDVRVENADTGAVLFRGQITDYEPGGVAREGATITASGPTWELKNTNTRINGRGHYTWNYRGGTGDEGQAGYDSPGRDGEKWTAGEICVDILEHALGTGVHSSTTTSGTSQSAIEGHHSDDADVTDTYLGTDVITDWDPSEWLALDTVIGEFTVEDTSVADALETLVGRAGGFYGWYIDAAGALHLVDLTGLPETDIEAGERGHWVGEDGTDYRLLNNRLQWSLDGVASRVVIQGKDRVVEEKPANIEGSGNAGKGDKGELELVSEPWEGYASAYRPRYQDKRHPTLKTIDENSSYTPPEGWWGFNHAPRVYEGAPGDPKTVYKPSDHGLNTTFPDVLPESGAVGFYQTPNTTNLWLWYWAAVPFTVEAGPAGDAYERYGYDRTLTIYDKSFKHPDSYPQSGDSDETTRMQTLADRMLEQRKDVRRQGTLEVDGADPASYGLDSRYNVLNLGPTTTTSGSTSTTSGTVADPTEWDRLKINAVEVTYDLERDTTSIRVANTFFMLEGYSEIRRRLKNDLGRARERNRTYYSSYTMPTSDSPEGQETQPEPKVDQMIVADQDMVADDSLYTCYELDADGTWGRSLNAKRPPGLRVDAGDVGFLAADTDGENMFAPAYNTARQVQADEDMTADDTFYSCSLLNTDGTTGYAVSAKRPRKLFVASGDIGYLGEDQVGENVFIPAGTVATPGTTDTVSQGVGDGEAADGTSWDATADESTGLKLTAVTRVDYYDAGNEKLYGYERVLTFDQEGRLVEVSGETRVAIDTPESC